MREFLDDEVAVVGVGGVASGEDAFNMILCGAVAVQVGTCHWVEGGKCFNRISDELIAIMKEKGYKNIEDFRGKIKNWSKGGADIQRKNKKLAKENEAKKSSAAVKTAADEKGDKATMFLLLMLVPVLVVIIAVLIGERQGLIQVVEV